MIFGERVNLHTHTTRCKHATGAMAEYCREAQAQGLKVLGFSDHSPFADDRFLESRMVLAELDDYLADIEQARREFPELTILAGLEVDYLPELGRSFYEDTFSGRGLDYLIAGTHFIPPYLPEDDIWLPGVILSDAGTRRFIDTTIETMATGLFVYQAHPDIFCRCRPVWTPELKAMCRDLADAAKSFGVPLEINAFGLRKTQVATPEGSTRPGYPWPPFWELMGECGAPMVVGADAHRPADVWGNSDDAVELGAACGLAPQNAAVAAAILDRRPGGI